MLSKYAILLDGGFVTKKLQAKLSRFPTAADVAQGGDRRWEMEGVKEAKGRSWC